MTWRLYDHQGSLCIDPGDIIEAGPGCLGGVALTRDLGGTYAAPTAVGLLGRTIPTRVANQFLKSNGTNSALEFKGYSFTIDSVCQGNDSRLNAGTESSEGYLRSKLTTAKSAAISFAATTAPHYAFLGRTSQNVAPRYIRFQVFVAGSGAEVNSVAFLSSTGPPDRANKTLTVLAAQMATDSTSTTGVKANSSAFNTIIPAGTYLWAGIRLWNSITRPSVSAVIHDMEQGEVLVGLNADPEFDAASTFTAYIVPVAFSPVTSGPNIYATLN